MPPSSSLIAPFSGEAYVLWRTARPDITVNWLFEVLFTKHAEFATTIRPLVFTLCDVCGQSQDAVQAAVWAVLCSL